MPPELRGPPPAIRGGSQTHNLSRDEQGTAWQHPVVVFADGEDASQPADSAALAELPPSAKLVYKVLEYEAPLTQGEVRERTRLSKRTTRHAISLLTDADLLEERVYIPDARKRIYEPRVVD